MLTDLHTLTESTPFMIVDMLFHIWLIGHLVHHIVHLVPRGHDHISAQFDWWRWRWSIYKRDAKATRVRRHAGSIT